MTATADTRRTVLPRMARLPRCSPGPTTASSRSAPSTRWLTRTVPLFTMKSDSPTMFSTKIGAPAGKAFSWAMPAKRRSADLA